MHGWIDDSIDIVCFEIVRTSFTNMRLNPKYRKTIGLFIVRNVDNDRIKPQQGNLDLQSQRGQSFQATTTIDPPVVPVLGVNDWVDH